MVLTPDNEVRLVVQTQGGLVVLGSDLLGEKGVQQVLDTRLALTLSAVAALPDGRLAIASSRSAGAILTLVDRNGNVELEKSFAQENAADAQAVAYNATRGEILLGGSYRGEDEGTQRTWMIATDLHGSQTWELTREPLDFHGVDGNITALPAGRGPGIADLVPAPDGSFLAPGDSTFELTYFTVGAGGCND